MELLTDAVMIGPALALVALFVLIPIAIAAYLSFTDWDGFTIPPSWIGTRNYERLLQDSEVFRAATYTGVIAVVGTLACNALGLGIALLLNRNSRVNTVMRVLVFSPYVIGPIILGFLWASILGTNGAVNSLLTSLGVDRVPFLADPTWAMVTTVLVIIWASFGLNVILYLAGLQTLDASLLEARDDRRRRPLGNVLARQAPGARPHRDPKHRARSHRSAPRLRNRACAHGRRARGHDPDRGLHDSHHVVQSLPARIRRSPVCRRHDRDHRCHGGAHAATPSERGSGVRMMARRVAWLAAILALVALMGAPLYLLITNAFKTEDDILGAPFAPPAQGFTIENLLAAATSTDFNVIAAYGTTAFLVVIVNVLSILVTGPAAYAIARGTRRIHRTVMLVMLAGLFIPSQTIVIPVIYVLKTVGLMGTMPGLILFQTALTIPTTLFLFTAYVQSIPRELDEAARIDGASRIGTFWRVIFPLMAPAIATAVVLNAVDVWADFVNPRIILGPGSGLYTVTTGVFAAIDKYSTDYTLVYSNMLLAVVPVTVFYVLLQKRIIGGLTSGAVKG